MRDDPPALLGNPDDGSFDLRWDRRESVMAARTNRPFQTEQTRAKIQTTQLLKRLTGHALGEVDMNPSQVRAIEILLKKTLPDLSAVAMTGEDGGDIKHAHKITVEFIKP